MRLTTNKNKINAVIKRRSNKINMNWETVKVKEAGKKSKEDKVEMSN